MKYTNTEKPKRYKREYNVYKIVNDIDSKVYIGSTTTELWHRMGQHRNDAKRGEHSPLYRHMRELGAEHFKIEKICSVDPEKLREVEEMVIATISIKDRLNSKKTCKNDHSRHFDYQEIVDTYKRLKSVRATADIIGCSIPTVKKALRKLSTT